MSRSDTAATAATTKRWRLPGLIGVASLAIALSLAIAPIASAATLTNSWKAKVGTGGANGLATLNTYTTGTGSLVLKLAKLKPSTLLAVTLLRGSCSGAAFLTLASVKSTSAGAVAKTVALTASQAAKIQAAGTAGKIAFRIGAGTTKKCGVFAAQPVPAYVKATISVGIYPFDVTLTPSNAWVVNGGSNSLSKIDLVTDSLLSEVQLGNVGEGFPLAVTYDDGALWVAVTVIDTNKTPMPGRVQRVDPTTGQVTATIPVGTASVDIDSTPGAVWVANSGDGTVSRIDTSSNQIVATVTLTPGVSGIAVGEGSVWVANEKSGTVSRIDPASNTVVATIQTVGAAEGIVDGAGSIWVSNAAFVGNGVMSRIDPATNQVVHVVPVGSTPLFLAFGGGYVWVSLGGEPTLVQVNPQTNAVQARVAVGAKSWGIAATNHDVWLVHSVAAGADPTSPTPGTVSHVRY